MGLKNNANVLRSEKIIEQAIRGSDIGLRLIDDFLMQENARLRLFLVLTK